MIARAVMVIFAPVFGTLPAAARMPYDGDGKVSGAADNRAVLDEMVSSGLRFAALLPMAN